MRFRCNIHMKDVYEYLRNMNPTYIFEPDTYLNLITITKLGYMMNGLLNDVENILMFSDDGFVELSIKTNDQDMINILNQARSMLNDFNI